MAKRREAAADTSRRTPNGGDGGGMAGNPVQTAAGMERDRAFLMDRENGSLRVDAPGSSSLTVQVRWKNAAKPQQSGLRPPTTPRGDVAERLRRPYPPVPKTDMKANIESVLKRPPSRRRRPEPRSRAPSARKRPKAPTTNAAPSTSPGPAPAAARARSGMRHLPPDRDRAGGRAGEGSGGHQRRGLAALCDPGRPSDRRLRPVGALRSADRHPGDFRLEEQKLLSGYLHLSFAREAKRSSWTAGDWRT